MQTIIPFVVVLLVGVGIALETPTNALLMKTSGSLLWASLISFAVGTAVLIAAIAATRARLEPNWVSATPWYAWVGGVYGAAVVAASAWATPKLGAGATLVIIVAAQVALGVALDNFSALGLAHHPASWLRMAGVALVVGGALMVALG